MTTGKIAEGSFQLIGGNFTSAGESSLELKRVLMKSGLRADIVKRAAVVAFEAEMNVIIHAAAGWMRYYVTQDQLKIVVEDMGPGIKDIDLAMKEGYSTAPEWVREMGWGAGMGLPNIRKNADTISIDSVVGEGTTVEITINLTREE